MTRKHVFFLLLVPAIILAYSVISKTREPVRPLRVITCNVGDLDDRHADLNRVVELLGRDSPPDVVLLQEVWGKTAAASIARRLGMSSHVYADYENHHRYGLAILSRTSELQNPMLYTFKESENSRGVLIARLLFNGERLTVASIHLDRVQNIETKESVDISMGKALELLLEEMTGETIRSRCVREFLEWLPPGHEKRFIVGGDFNAVPFTKPIRLMNDRFEDALWPSIDFFRGSFTKTSLVIHPRLDYIFHTSDLVCRDAFIIKETAGDHRPFMALFDF